MDASKGGRFMIRPEKEGYMSVGGREMLRKASGFFVSADPGKGVVILSATE